MIFPGHTHSGPSVPPREPMNQLAAGRRFAWPMAAPLPSCKVSDRGEIKGAQESIVFTRPTTSSASIPSDVSVRVSLPNGKDFARYHLDGEVPQKLGEQIRDVLSFGELGIVSPTDTLKQLINITRSCPALHWTPQRLDCVEKSERWIEPMRRIVPTLEEFVRDPVGSCFRFFCAKPVNDFDWRMEAELKPGQKFAIIELSAKDPQKRQVEKKFFQLQAESEGRTSLQDLTLRCYTTMELFWSKGPEAVIDFLVKAQEDPQRTNSSENDAQDYSGVVDWQSADLFDLDQRLMEGFFEPSMCQFTHTFKSGAELLLAMGQEAAVLRIRSRADDGAPFFEWRFQNSAGDFSDHNDPQRKEILRAFRMVKSESGSLRLAAIDSLNILKIQYNTTGPEPERLLGLPLSEHLYQLPGLVVSSYAPYTPHAVVDLLQGKESIKLTLADPRPAPHQPSLKERTPHLFHSAVLGSLPDGTLMVTVANLLNGQCSALVSPTALKRYGSGDYFVRSLAEAMAQQTTNGFSAVQRVLELACSLDKEGSYYVVDGEPSFSELPPTGDALGQHMYQIASGLVQRYAAISHSSPTNYKVGWVAPGSVEATLGMDHEPFLMKLTLKDHQVTKIEVIPQKAGPDGTVEPDTEKALTYYCNLTFRGATDARVVAELQTVLDLFNTVLSDNDLAAASGTPSIQTTQLYRFLERRFARA